MRFRTATREDLGALCAFFDDVVAALEDAACSPRWDRDFYPDDEMLSDLVEDGEFVLGEEGELVCAGALSDIGSDGIAEVHLLAVHPSKVRRGHAHALLDELVRRARDAGARAVRLDVISGNTPALRLYESYGFSHAGTREAFFERTGRLSFDLYKLEV